mmetsp:Transcript_30078/g.64887  ORF Transcript_30078/g.64887 Transcript_30078/m.64887 type:complete len:111 (-) Transcript_30078:857-1189(-)
MSRHLRYSFPCENEEFYCLLSSFIRHNTRPILRCPRRIRANRLGMNQSTSNPTYAYRKQTETPAAPTQTRRIRHDVHVHERLIKMGWISSLVFIGVNVEGISMGGAISPC